MSSSPNYASTPIVGAALLTTGDASRTAPAIASELFNPGANGGACERIVIEPVATTVASVIRIFRHDGMTYHLYTEVQLQVQTAAGSTAIAPQTLQAVDYPQLFPIAVPAGWTLKCSVNDTQAGVKVQAEGGGY